MTTVASSPSRPAFSVEWAAYQSATAAVELARKRRDGTVTGHARAQRRALRELLEAERRAELARGRA